MKPTAGWTGELGVDRKGEEATTLGYASRKDVSPHAGPTDRAIVRFFGWGMWLAIVVPFLAGAVWIAIMLVWG